MEIIILIARIVLLIAGGKSAIDATLSIANSSGVDFSTLWDALDSIYK